MDAPRAGQQPVRRANGQGKRLCISLLLSLLFHALLLGLTFGGQEFGLPGLALPWQERRIEVPDLRVVLAPLKVTDPKSASTSPDMPFAQVLSERSVAGGPAVVTFKSPARSPAQSAPASVPRSTPKAKPGPRSKAATSTTQENVPRSTPKAKASPRPKAAARTAPRSTSKAKASPRPKAATSAAKAKSSRSTAKVATARPRWSRPGALPRRRLAQQGQR